MLTGIRLPQYFWCLFCIASCDLLFAQQEVHDLHEPLQTSEALTFTEVMENTWMHAPEYLEYTVRQEQADNYSASGRSWVSGRPSLALSYNNDSRLDNVGLRELEYGIQLPLWRPGERHNASVLGESFQQQLGEWQVSLRLVLAGKVRAVLADIQEAETLLRLEQEATAQARQLVAVTNTLFDAGEVARLDVMQVESLLLAQRKRELDADAMYVDAERSYTVLTGLQVRPASPHRESRTADIGITAAHPLLRYLQTEVDLAEANIQQSTTTAKGNPLLTVGSRRERSDRFQPYTDSVGVSLTVPFGGKALVASRSSSARRDKVDAEVEYLNTQRNLDMALHEVEHELFITSEMLPLVTEQAALAESSWQMAETAFAQGEITLVQVMLALQQARTAARELELLQLTQQRLVTEFNQISGVLP